MSRCTRPRTFLSLSRGTPLDRREIPERQGPIYLLQAASISQSLKAQTAITREWPLRSASRPQSCEFGCMAYGR